MIKIYDKTLYIIFYNIKIELWVQYLLNWDYLRLYLIPSFELILRESVFGVILNTNFLIINCGLSIQKITEKEKEDILEELKGD